MKTIHQKQNHHNQRWTITKHKSNISTTDDIGITTYAAGCISITRRVLFICKCIQHVRAL